MTVRDAARAAQDAVDPLVQLYKDAHSRLRAEQDALLGDPLRKARISRLLELQARIRREMDRLDRDASVWLGRHAGEPYVAGFVAQPLDTTFTAVHRESARRLADDMFDDLLSATRFVRQDTKRFIFEAARIAAQSTVVDNTAKQAGRDMMKDLVENHGIKAVRYRNGAAHPLGEYSQMVIRTKTALAFNQGGFTAGEKVEWWECFDGPNCGLTFHEDGEMANGMIADRLTARAWPISHPNCRRSWGARPDVENKTQAAKEQATRAERLAAAQHAVG